MVTHTSPWDFNVGMHSDIPEGCGALEARGEDVDCVFHGLVIA